MKILHVVYSGLGGHGNVFFSMVDADVTKEFQYEVLFFGIEDVRDAYIKKAEAAGIPWSFVKKKPGFDFKAYGQIENIIRQSMPAIIFLHTSAYIFPAKKALLFRGKKIKIVVRETQPNHLKSKLEWVGLFCSLLIADKVVFLSTAYRDYIKKRFRFIFSAKRTAVIPNGVNLGVFRPIAKETGPFINIGMQSRLSETKDHSTLIDAFAILLGMGSFPKPLKLYIAGDGNCRAALENQVKALNITGHVIFTGMLEEKELPGFINSLDIYVHATLGETMSTAIMQVMACRLPVIASAVLGVDNMIENKVTGILVPAKDAQALANAVEQIINDPVLAGQLAANAFNFAVTNYSNKKMLASYKTLFTS